MLNIILYYFVILIYLTFIIALYLYFSYAYFMNKHSLTRQAQHILNNMAKIPYSLGRMEEIAIKIVEIQKRLDIEITNPTLLLACADHEIIEEGISPSTSKITYQQVFNFQQGGGACSLLAKANNVDLKIYNIAMNDSVDKSWNVSNKYFVRNSDSNPLKGISISQEEVITTISNGRAAVKAIKKNGCNTILLGEMGVGNSTISSLLVSSILNKNALECVDKSHCVNDIIYNNKVQFINKAKALHDENIHDIYDTISKYGGFEIAFLAGAILQSVDDNMCVLIDGFITSTSLLIAHEINPNCLNNCIACSKSNEKTQHLINKKLQIKPLLDLKMSLGEGTAALTAVPIIKNAVFLFRNLGSCYHDGVNNVHPHIEIPFPLGTTSYIIKDNILNNLKYLTTLEYIEDIELVFFESKWPDNLPDSKTIESLKNIGEENSLSYTVHLPYDVDIASSNKEERDKAISTWTSYINATKPLLVHGYVAHIELLKNNIDNNLVISEDTNKTLNESLILAEDSLKQIIENTRIDSDMICIETLDQVYDNLFNLVKKLKLSVTLDVGHMVKYGYYSIDKVKELLPYTRIIHLHGVANKKDHSSLLMNTDFDIVSFLHLLQDYSYNDIVVTIEVFDRVKLLDSIEYLKTFKGSHNE